ncbi:MAG: SDR family oxidoreductase [Thiohalobacterales bacterium]|nr:SDR family oxidoreductase [Thiohalobacterales bacterium]
MKILVIGATGSIGRELVKQALAAGHAVTALAREPAKLGIDSLQLNTIRGDVMEPASLEAAMPGQDAVLCALGAGGKGGVRAPGTRNIIAAMQQGGIRRLICLSSLGVGKSRANLNFFWKHIMFGLLLRRAYADHVAQEEHVEDSGLDWTIVRPAAYTDGRLTGQYRHGFPATAADLELKIARADVADFMLKQLMDDGYLHMTPGLSY